MASVVHEGECCECCILMIANGDDSGCRDFFGHDHPAPMPEKITEGYAVATGSGDDSGETIMVGPCELCGQGGGGYMIGHPYAIIR